MDKFYMEVSVRQEGGKWIVTTIMPQGNTAVRGLDLIDSLREAGKEFNRECLRRERLNSTVS